MSIQRTNFLALGDEYFQQILSNEQKVKDCVDQPQLKLKLPIETGDRRKG